MGCKKKKKKKQDIVVVVAECVPQCSQQQDSGMGSRGVQLVYFFR